MIQKIWIFRKVISSIFKKTAKAVFFMFDVETLRAMSLRGFSLILNINDSSSSLWL